MSILVDERWIDAPRGTFVLSPAGQQHDFQNRSAALAGVLNFSIPVASRRTCRRLRNGSPKTRRKMRRRWNRPKN